MTNFAKQLEHIGKLIESEQDMIKRQKQRRVLKSAVEILELLNRGEKDERTLLDRNK